MPNRDQMNGHPAYDGSGRVSYGDARNRNGNTKSHHAGSGFAWEIGGQSSFRYPSPATAYGLHAYPPAADMRRGFARAADRYLPRHKENGKSPRRDDDARDAPAPKHSRLSLEGHSAIHGRQRTPSIGAEEHPISVRGSLSSDVIDPASSTSGVVRSTGHSGGRSGGGGGDNRSLGDDGRAERSRDLPRQEYTATKMGRTHDEEDCSPPGAQARHAHAKRDRSGSGSSSSLGGYGGRSSPFTAEQQVDGGHDSRASAAPEERVDESAASPSWKSIEAAGSRHLGGKSEERRARARVDPEFVSPFSNGCPVEGCSMTGAQNRGKGWMARHLAEHTKSAAESSETEGYVRSSVARVLHDLCLDAEVPTHHRKFERQKMARALLKAPREGLGMHVGVMESKLINDSKRNPRTRRCALDLAAGGCDGLDDPDSIVSCGKCGGWFHVSCGQMGLGDSITAPDAVKEVLCSSCSRLAVGALGKEPGEATQKQAAVLRAKRKSMLAFLEADLKTASAEGIFDLNMSTEASGARNEQGGHNRHGPGSLQCTAQRCEQRCRPDSRFCSDRCGVSHAERLLADALRHSLEERLGKERGHRLREIRELKTRKQEVEHATKKMQQPRPPTFSAKQESSLRTIVDKRRHLWKRLVEIRAYWEKVSGSRKLPMAVGSARVASSEESTETDKVTGGKSDQSRAAGSGTSGGGVTAGVEDRETGSSNEDSGARAGSGGRGGDGDRPQSKTCPRGGRTAMDEEEANPGAEIPLIEERSTKRKAIGSMLGKEQGANDAMVVDEGESGADRKVQRETAKVLGESTTGEALESSLQGPTESLVTEMQGVKRSAVTLATVSSNRVLLEDAEPEQEVQVDVGVEADLEAPTQVLGDRNTPDGIAGADARRETGEESRHTKRIDEATAETTPTVSKTPKALLSSSSPPQVKAAAVVPREGLEDLTCVYCGEETGPGVMRHLETCYRKVAAKRNKLLESASLRPNRCQPKILRGSSHDSAAAVAATSVDGSIAPLTSFSPLCSYTAAGRQLLVRRIACANFDALPDPEQFQLHEDLKGWMGSPSRLDFLYKELIRQRNAAIDELQALDNEEAELEVHLRLDWMRNGLEIDT